MTDYDLLIERAQIDFGMDSHAPNCSFTDILDALYWAKKIHSFAPWCAIAGGTGSTRQAAAPGGGE